MNLADLTTPFTLNMKFIAPLHYITLNGKTTVMNEDEFEALQYGLTDLLHACAMYTFTRDKDLQNIS